MGKARFISKCHLSGIDAITCCDVCFCGVKMERYNWAAMILRMHVFKSR